MRVLVTGGAGFIGSNLVRYLLGSRPALSVVNLDLLTYAGNLENLRDLHDHPRHHFVRGDICDRNVVDSVLAAGVDAVLHCAAESHVDRSIAAPEEFIRTNVTGTLVLLEASRARGVGRFVQVSTDEVYGSLGATGAFDENSPVRPSSPYAASKAAGDLFALSYWTTYGFPVIVSRCSNNFGPFQFPEKVIPLFATNALQDLPLPLYGLGEQRRDWLFVEDHCAALAALLDGGRPGEIYNVGGGTELSNRDLGAAILEELGKPLGLLRSVADRPGHDFRYAVDTGKLRSEVGWRPRHEFRAALRSTLAWYRSNRDWWERVRSGEYRNYYQAMYGERFAEATPV